MSQLIGSPAGQLVPVFGAKPAPIKPKFQSYFPLWALAALMAYQLLLCFLNTRVMAISNNIVAGCELFILFTMIVKILPQRPIADFAIPAIGLGYLSLLWLVRGEIDLYAPRDLMIIILSFWMGQYARSIRDVNFIIGVIFLIVFAFGAMEYIFTPGYVKYFDILKYTMARGLVTEQAAKYNGTNLFLSGTRLVGRTLLPFLGNQRISSIFFEPVSMGNFGVILGMWGLSFSGRQWRQMLLFLGMSAVVIIACDSRFASMIFGILIIVRLVPVLQSRLVLLAMPVVVVSGLLAFAIAHPITGASDDLPGRIMRTSEILVKFDITNVFGLEPIRAFFGDSGIPLSLEMFGALGCIALWIAFTRMKLAVPQGHRLRGMTSVYCLALLVISGSSFYSSKTAALLWFLFGALSCNSVIQKRERGELVETGDAA